MRKLARIQWIDNKKIENVVVAIGEHEKNNPDDDQIFYYFEDAVEFISFTELGDNEFIILDYEQSETEQIMSLTDVESYLETHYIISNWIEDFTDQKIPLDQKLEGVVGERFAEFGTGGMWQLAQEWTNEFQKQHALREWDGEFFDELDDFLEKKNQLK